MSEQAVPRHRPETIGLAYGMLGVLMLSATLPMTRLAVAEFDPVLVGMARALLPAIPAALLLLVTKQARPTQREIGALLIASIGIVYGFPILMSVAMKTLPSAHGAVVTGIMPLATAAVGAVVSGDRPSLGFWLCGVAGSAAVVVYALIDGAGSISWADLVLLLAIATAALGYAVGGQIAKRLGGLADHLLDHGVGFAVLDRVGDRAQPAPADNIAANVGMARIDLRDRRQPVLELLRLVSRLGAGRRHAGQPTTVVTALSHSGFRRVADWRAAGLARNRLYGADNCGGCGQPYYADPS